LYLDILAEADPDLGTLYQLCNVPGYMFHFYDGKDVEDGIYIHVTDDSCNLDLGGKTSR